MDKLIAQDLDAKERTRDVVYEEYLHFETFLLSEKVLNGLKKAGFIKPSPVQVKAVPLGRCGFDLIVKSKSGTGKTAIFSIVALEMLDLENPNLQVLIIAPTREIAVQIQFVLQGIGQCMNSLKIETFIGGFPEKDDVEKISGCHIAVCAPGRIKSLIKQKIAKLDHVRLFVLDEADKLMEECFQSDINEIYHSLPIDKQMIATSATYPGNLQKFLSNYMRSPTYINVEVQTPLLLGIRQFVKVINSSSNVVQQMKVKNEELINVLSKVHFSQCLVFCNYQTRAQSISNYVNSKGLGSKFISAAQNQSKRLETLGNFRESKSRILFSTDLTARGIDSPNVNLIINYDVPIDYQTYMHRMGRAGRYGSYGVCISLVSEGVEMEQFWVILRNIDSKSSVIAKLPNLDNIDVFKANVDELEMIEMVDKSLNDIPNKDVLESKTGTKPATNTELIVDSSSEISSSLDDNPTLLESLASDNFDFSNVETKSSESSSCEIIIDNLQITTNSDSNPPKTDDFTEAIQKLASGDFDFTKLPEKDSNTSDKENESNNNKMKTFFKNRALYNVAQILNNSSNSVTEEAVNSLTKYMNLENETKNITEYSNVVDQLETLNVNELVNNIKNISTKSDIPQNSAESEVYSLDNIFTRAYDYTLGRGKHWNLCIENVEDPKQEESTSTVRNSLIECSDNADSESDDESEENCYDVQTEENCSGVQPEENSKIPPLSDEYPTLEWIPVEEKSKEMVPNVTNTSRSVNEHFDLCFYQCSENLWQTALSFQTAAEFDNWYCDNWCANLENVRNYVSQNIYVSELNNYRKNRGNCDF